eukprot:359985-Chlamydomonas_euryale.AAC.9
MSLPGSEWVGLQFGSLMQHYRVVIYGGAGAAATYIVWRSLHSAASLLAYMHGPELNDSVLLGASAALVAAVAIYSRSHFVLSTSVVYNAAVQQLSASAAVREVLGTPVVARTVRVASLSGGGLRLKDLRVKTCKPRLTMAFEVAGPQQSGMVAVEARKKRGRHVLTMLAVDVVPHGSLAAPPHAKQKRQQLAGAARLFLEGNEKLYSRTQPLLESLRSPLKHSADMQAG